MDLEPIFRYRILMAPSGIPAYEPMLAAYHRTFAVELRAIVDSLPITGGQRVLDMACGAGTYTPWLADRVGAQGHVAAVDSNPHYLELARDECAQSAAAGVVEFIQAPINALPFAEGTFDLCWCAHSLYSLPDPVDALRHMRRVTKPGGIVAVLENDTLHHVILPWPADVELAVSAAELRFLTAKTDQPHKYYVGRRLRSVFLEAGFDEVAIRTIACDRIAPLEKEERGFFVEHLKAMSVRLADHLDGAMRRSFEALASPESDEFLLNERAFAATCIEQLAVGVKQTNAIE